MKATCLVVCRLIFHSKRKKLLVTKENKFQKFLLKGSIRLLKVEGLLLGDNPLLSVIVSLQVVYYDFYKIESILPTHYEGKNDEKLGWLNIFEIFKFFKVPRIRQL